MKRNQLSNYLITTVVVACSVVLLIAMSLALMRSTWVPSGERTVRVDFPNVTGLRVHSGVRYAGAPAGTVIKIEAIPLEEKRQSQRPDQNVRVTVRLRSDIPDLLQGTTAEISSDTILSEKFLNLLPGPVNAPKLAADAIIPSRPVATFDDLARSGMVALDEINSILTQVKAADPEIGNRLTSIVQNGDKLIVEVNNLVADGKKLLGKSDGFLEDLRSFIGSARRLAENLESGLAGNELNLQQILQDLEVVMKNAKVVTTYAKLLSGTLAQRPWRLVFGGEVPTLPGQEEIIQSNRPVPVVIPTR